MEFLKPHQPFNTHAASWINKKYGNCVLPISKQKQPLAASPAASSTSTTTTTTSKASPLPTVAAIMLLRNNGKKGAVSPAKNVKVACLCAPSSHPGSFRCRYHRKNPPAPAAPPSLEAPLSSMMSEEVKTLWPKASDGVLWKVEKKRAPGASRFRPRKE